jgi:site-specific DNA-methyltransferase (cytosine-N4-specific)
MMETLPKAQLGKINNRASDKRTHTDNASPVISYASEIIIGDAQKALLSFPDNIFQMCVTSPPYWGLRDYGVSNQIGAEQEVDQYISNLVGIFREVKRTLKPDGTLWLNIGDSYTSGNRRWRDADKKNPARAMNYRPPTPEGLKPKDLIGVPWKLAFALQKDGWYLRSDIIWHKPNCQPESVKDRPTKSHEYVFLFSKDEKYYYDHLSGGQKTLDGGHKNQRTVWSINTEPFDDAHFAVFPESLVLPCLLAGSKEGDRILDPFLGSGTSGAVALKKKRTFVGIEVNRKYVEIAQKRIRDRNVLVREVL